MEPTPSIDNVAILVMVGIVAIVALSFVASTRWLQSGRKLYLRPLGALDKLRQNIGLATESDTPFHVSLGRAGLSSVASPTSVAALAVVDRVAKDGCASATPPLVTTGDGTLLLVAQRRLMRAFRRAGRTAAYDPHLARFIASDTAPYAYAAGVTSAILQEKIASNVLVGRFGPELAIMADAAARENVDQIIGTDDPTSLALAAAITDHLLIGEELFAASAYLEGKTSQLAMLRTQDILRLLIALTILGLAIYRFLPVQ